MRDARRRSVKPARLESRNARDSARPRRRVLPREQAETQCAPEKEPRSRVAERTEALKVFRECVKPERRRHPRQHWAAGGIPPQLFQQRVMDIRTVKHAWFYRDQIWCDVGIRRRRKLFPQRHAAIAPASLAYFGAVIPATK